jgi:hypothetical protein
MIEVVRGAQLRARQIPRLFRAGFLAVTLLAQSRPSPSQAVGGPSPAGVQSFSCLEKAGSRGRIGPHDENFYPANTSGGATGIADPVCTVRKRATNIKPNNRRLQEWFYRITQLSITLKL